MKISHGKNIRTLLLSAIMLGLASPLLAQETNTADNTMASAEPSAVTPEAQAVLDNMTAYLKTLNSFTIQSNSTRDEVVAFGYKLQHNESATLTVQRPNLLHSVVSGDIRNRTVVYDGKSLVMYSPEDNAYTRVPAPDNIGKLIGGLINAGIELPALDVLYQSYTGNMAEDVRGGIWVGESKIEGVVCDHLAFRQADTDWQIWVEKGTKPLLRKLVVTTRYEVGDPQYQSILHWNVNPKIDKSTFVFKAPEGANEIQYVDPASINVDTTSGE
jgi:hypothetical protein